MAKVGDRVRFIGGSGRIWEVVEVRGEVVVLTREDEPARRFTLARELERV